MQKPRQEPAYTPWRKSYAEQEDLQLDMGILNSNPWRFCGVADIKIWILQEN